VVEVVVMVVLVCVVMISAVVAGGGSGRQTPVQRTGHLVSMMANCVHISFVYVVPHCVSASG